MTDKVYGFAGPEQALTGNLNTYIVRTLVNITPIASTGTYVPSYVAGVGPNYSDVRVIDSQFCFDKLIEAISSRGQPVILGNVIQTSETTPSDLPAASTISGSVTVYNLIFTIEHNQSWEVQGNNETLAETLNDLSTITGYNGASVGFVYTTPTNGNNVSVSLLTPTSNVAGTLLLAALGLATTSPGSTAAKEF
jgi:hypothetical protein